MGERGGERVGEGEGGGGEWGVKIQIILKFIKISRERKQGQTAKE